MEKDDKLQNFIDILINGNGLNLDNFNGSYDGEINGDNSDRTKFSKRANDLWYQLLYHLKNGVYNTNDKKKHIGIRENDFPSSEIGKSVAQFISEKADLDLNLFKNARTPQDFFELYISSRDIDEKEYTHWNESVAKLADYYYSIFYTDILNNQQIANSNFTYGDLKIQDAGWSFEDIFDPVRPKYSNEIKEIKENNQKIYKTYRDIRGKDAIANVLKDISNLQFTQTKSNEQKINQYMRLIMPEYKRIVEIEDLNRNFWVIGQSLTALFSLLFDDNSVYPTLLSALLDEIVQLWENIFYLWICLIIFSQKKEPYEDIKVLFLPISSDNYNFGENEIKFDNIKFDNFAQDLYKNYTAYISPSDESDEEREQRENNNTILEKLWTENLYYLKNKYNNCGLVIIPEIREKNYAHNYYSKTIYPGIIFYDDSIQEEVHFSPFKYPIIVDMKEQLIHYTEENE